MMRGVPGVFVVARNPDPDSSLPYVIRLPLGDHGLVLKARDSWPRTAKVYCHRATAWPEGAEVVEEVPVRACVRRGVAVDLVLDRKRENRSQLVFTRLAGGREAIFWQTARTARTTRPGVRMPGRRASGIDDLVITVDTRERYAFRFAARKATVQRRALPAGDYGVLDGDDLVAVVERKSVADLVKGLSDGTLNFQLADLAALPRAAVVVEDRYSRLFKLEHAQPGWAPDMVARLQVRYPGVPIVFVENRQLAEEWTFRFLGAALAVDREQPDDPTAPRSLPADGPLGR